MAIANDLEIVNAALIRAGATPLASFTDPAEMGRNCRAVFDSLRRAKVEDYPWRFALRQSDLAQLSDNGSDYALEYDYAYSLPNDYMRALGVYDRSQYEIFGNELYTNASSVRLTYVANVGSAHYSEAFRLALEYSLAAEFSVTVMEEHERAKLLHSLAEKQWKIARTRDAQSVPLTTLQGGIDGFLYAPPYPGLGVG